MGVDGSSPSEGSAATEKSALSLVEAKPFRSASSS
jgi:hypothetical protein